VHFGNELDGLGDDHGGGFEGLVGFHVLPLSHRPAIVSAGEPSRAVKYQAVCRLACLAIRSSRRPESDSGCA
jgi:hypothetical protein